MLLGIADFSPIFRAFAPPGASATERETIPVGLELGILSKFLQMPKKPVG